MKVVPNPASGNAKNKLLAAVVPIPSLLFHLAFLRTCGGVWPEEGSWWGGVCRWGSHHPIWLLNLLFFFNVNVLFWIISLVQQSTWLIDLYWTVLPVMINHYFASLGGGQTWRGRVVSALVWAWSFRLTHSYLRRENWQWGEREDWRFAQLRQQHKRHWWWLSFFLVYVSQQVFLVGICLPLFTIHSSGLAWNWCDTVSTAICVTGVGTAHLSDTQLHRFVQRKQKVKEAGGPTVGVLQEGLWSYSRHPNYVGEQLWWWGLSLFACRLGRGWECAGAGINSACLAYVTVLVERRMVALPSRAAEYREYQRRTWVWIPLWAGPERERERERGRARR